MNNTTAPGWYPVNEARELGYFDGAHWTGDRVPNPDHQPKRRTGWAVAGFVLLLVVLVVGWAGLEVLLQAAG